MLDPAAMHGLQLLVLGASVAMCDQNAAEAARALAAVCRKRGLVQQAESLEAQAAAIEQSYVSTGANPPPPAAQPPS